MDDEEDEEIDQEGVEPPQVECDVNVVVDPDNDDIPVVPITKPRVEPVIEPSDEQQQEHEPSHVFANLGPYIEPKVEIQDEDNDDKTVYDDGNCYEEQQEHQQPPNFALQNFLPFYNPNYL